MFIMDLRFGGRLSPSRTLSRAGGSPAEPLVLVLFYLGLSFLLLPFFSKLGFYDIVGIMTSLVDYNVLQTTFPATATVRHFRQQQLLQEGDTVSPRALLQRHKKEKHE